MGKQKKIDPICKSGVTLIEVIVALAVLAILSTVGVGIFLSINNAYSKSEINNRLRQEGLRVMEEMSRVIKSGSNLNGVGNCNGAVCDGLEITVSPQSLEYAQNGNCEKVVFQYQNADSNRNNYINKTLSGGSSCSPVGAGAITSTDRRRGVDVNLLEFTVTDGGGVYPDRVKIKMVLQQGLDVPQRQEYKGQVTLEEIISTRGY